MDELNNELADILEIESISDDSEFKSCPNWDSLAILSLLAYIDKIYGVQIYNNELDSISKLKDLKKLILEKK